MTLETLSTGDSTQFLSFLSHVRQKTSLHSYPLTHALHKIWLHVMKVQPYTQGRPDPGRAARSTKTLGLST